MSRLTTAKLDLGHAVIRPATSVVAGSWVTRTLIYTAGHPVDDSGYIKIVFRSPGDFGTPQFERPSSPNYCSVASTGDCQIEPRWDPKGHVRPWSMALYLKVTRGFLDRGEKILLTFGDRSQGSRGWRIQTFCERRFEFKTLVDPVATYRFKELPGSPTLRVLPGKPVRAVCLAPSQVVLRRPFSYHVKREDAWGNPVGRPRRHTHPGFTRTGVDRIHVARSGACPPVTSNPIRVLEAPARLQPFWADFHGQSAETIGTHTIDDYFAFARDRALLDIAAHQGNDFQISDTFWRTINRTARAYDRPGRFVTFPGYEWSGNTPLGGDRNVFFANDRGRIARSGTDLVPGDASRFPDAQTAAALFRNLRAQKSARPFVFAHVGGRYATQDMHDDRLEIGMEVHSAWGTFEWLVHDALARGHRVGICANSDEHKGRPGASYPGAGKFGSFGGLTCVLSRALTRSDVYEAMMARHFFATTGHRPLLEVTLDTGDGRTAMMGDVIRGGRGSLRLQVRTAGTAPIEKIEVFSGVRRIRTFVPRESAPDSCRIKILWRGAEVRGRGRRVDWAGDLRLRGNRILRAVPVNFWNAAKPIRKVSSSRLSWESVTTGGWAGMIMDLERPAAGILELATLPCRLSLPLRSVLARPRVRPCGGLDKALEVYRLPDPPGPDHAEFTLPITGARNRHGAIFVKVTQEDGHAAWSSPIFLTR